MAVITLLGNHSIPSCSEAQYRVELQGLGHTVIALQENETTTQEILKVALESDLFFWVHSHGYKNPGEITMLEVLDKLRGAQIPSTAYHLDLYYPIERWREYETSDYFKVDHFFTVDPLMANWFNSHTTTKGHYLLAGAFSEQCYLADYDPEYTCDVAFIGSKGYHHEWPYRPQLINWLQTTYGNGSIHSGPNGNGFIHWGPDGKRTVRDEAFNKACANAKIIVGDSLCMNFNYPGYWSERLYNVAGACGFQIFPYIPGIEESYMLGEQLITYKFNDFHDLQTKINYYLEHEKERSQIKLAAYKRTINDHTYKGRMTQMLGIVIGE